MTGRGGHDGGELGGIRAARTENIAWVKFVVELIRANIPGRIRIRCSSFIDQMVDDAVARKVIKPVGEIFPEEEFGPRPPGP